MPTATNVERFPSFDGVEIVYRTWGQPSARPPVVLHHGFVTDGPSNWEATGVVDALLLLGLSGLLSGVEPLSFGNALLVALALGKLRQFLVKLERHIGAITRVGRPDTVRSDVTEALHRDFMNFPERLTHL